MFINGQFSNLRIFNIKDKLIYIVDNHHYVLPIWANFSLVNKKSYTLVSIDYHPDTIPSFHDYAFGLVQKKNPYDHDDDEIDQIRKSEINKLRNTSIEVLVKALKNLKNDEHIDTAYELGFLNEYHIINCLDKCYEPDSYYYKNNSCSSRCTPSIRTGICDDVNCPPNLLKYKSNRLEDKYFDDMGFTVPNKPFILDIDLDYFPTRESLNPQNRTIINTLINNAEIITIAREKSYFNKSRQDKKFNVKEAEVLLIELITSALK